MELQDEKLSTEKRNSLPSKSFCAPNRGFPTNNCAHVSAGLRLLGRAKMSPAAKAKVHACIMRKSKTMGCSATAKDSEADIESIINSDEWQFTRDFIKWMEEVYVEETKSRDCDMGPTDLL